MNVGIYSLVATNLDTNQSTMIELTDKKENRYKTNLAYIDYLTTFFNDEQQLIDRLYQNKYIDFKKAQISIEYQNNGMISRIPVLYKPSIDFTKLVDKNSSTIDLNNEYFIRGTDTFILELNNEDFRNYVLNSNRINKYLKSKIIEFYKTEYIENLKFNKQKLLEAFSPYKTFRDFSFLLQKYKNKTKTTVIEEVEENSYHESDDEFLTEADWNNDYYPYNKQM